MTLARSSRSFVKHEDEETEQGRAHHQASDLAQTRSRNAGCR
jgi:hypothetical protein